MDTTPPLPAHKIISQKKKQAKKARLSEALRENLRKRKEQLRQRKSNQA